MFEGIIGMFGYIKPTNREIQLIDIVDNARIEGHDIFIDFLKTTKRQKIYVKGGKKIIYKTNLED